MQGVIKIIIEGERNILRRDMSFHYEILFINSCILSGLDS